MTTIDANAASPHDPPRPRVRVTLFRVLALWALGVTVVLALTMGFMNFSDVELIWSVPVEAVLLVVFCTAMMDLVYAARWRIWLRLAHPEGRFGLGSLWTYVTWSRLAAQILPIPGGSVGVRAAAVKTAEGMSIKRAACSVAVDPMLDLYQFLLVVPITAAMLLGYLKPSYAAICVVGALGIGALVLASAFPALVHLINALRRFARRRAADSGTSPADLPDFTRQSLLTAYAWTVLRYAFVVARIWAVGLAVRLVGLSFAFCLTTGTVTQAAHMTTITPGALGVLEGGWFAVLRAFEFPAADATLFVTAQRLLLWLALAVVAVVLTGVFVLTRNRGATDGGVERIGGDTDPIGAPAS